MSRLLIPLAALLIATPGAASAAASPVSLCGPARSIEGSPRIKRGTPYPDARRQLIAQGFAPVRIVSWPGVDSNTCKEGAPSEICAVYHEVEDCAGDAPLCRFLYRSRADGRYWVVLVEGEVSQPTVADMRHLRYCESWLEDFTSPYVVIGPDAKKVELKAKSRR